MKKLFENKIIGFSVIVGTVSFLAAMVMIFMGTLPIYSLREAGPEADSKLHRAAAMTHVGKILLAIWLISLLVLAVGAILDQRKKANHT